MPRLFVLSGVDLGRTFDLGDGGVIGRDPTCAARLRATSISRRHAHLERGARGWAVVDEGSRNGLIHEDVRVARLDLTDGAVFRLGDVELRFRDIEVVAGPPAVPRPAPVEPTFEPEEIELEDISLEDNSFEDEVAPSPAPAPTIARAPAPAPAPAAPRPTARERMAEELALGGARPTGGGIDPQGGGRPPLQYHAQASRRGLFVSDLSQLPGWMRTMLVIGAICLALGAFVVAFRATAALKGGGEPPALPPIEDGR